MFIIFIIFNNILLTNLIKIVEDNEINSKKLKVNHVKGNRHFYYSCWLNHYILISYFLLLFLETNRVGFQYMQRSADDIDDTSDDGKKLYHTLLFFILFY